VTERMVYQMFFLKTRFRSSSFNSWTVNCWYLPPLFMLTNTKRRPLSDTYALLRALLTAATRAPPIEYLTCYFPFYCRSFFLSSFFFRQRIFEMALLTENVSSSDGRIGPIGVILKIGFKIWEATPLQFGGP